MLSEFAKTLLSSLTDSLPKIVTSLPLSIDTTALEAAEEVFITSPRNRASPAFNTLCVPFSSTATTKPDTCFMTPI